MEDLASKLTQPFFQISSDISFNATLLIQLVVFLTLFFALNTLFWKPFLNLLDRRRALTTGSQEKAAGEEAELLRLEAEYQERVREARAAATEERQKQRAAADAAAKSTLDASRTEAARITDGIRADIEKATAEARSGLKAEADGIAKLMTNKVLGRPA